MRKQQKGFLKTNTKIVCREEESDALLFNPENGAIKILNRIGFEVWKLCDGTLALEQIIEKVQDEYPSAPDHVIKEDITNFINYMEKLDLIRLKE